MNINIKNKIYFILYLFAHKNIFSIIIYEIYILLILHDIPRSKGEILINIIQFSTTVLVYKK